MVDLSGTGWSSKYTTPSDGYFYINNAANQTATGYIEGNNGNNTLVSVIGGVQGSFSCYIKRGMNIFCTGTGTVTGFYPIKA